MICILKVYVLPVVSAPENELQRSSITTDTVCPRKWTSDSTEAKVLQPYTSLDTLKTIWNIFEEQITRDWI